MKIEKMDKIEKIRKCRSCGSEIKVEPGFHNWKKLFRKPSFEDWITLFILIMLIISAYSYKHDINQIKEYYESDGYCYSKINLYINSSSKSDIGLLNQGGIEITKKT